MWRMGMGAMAGRLERWVCIHEQEEQEEQEVLIRSDTKVMASGCYCCCGSTSSPLEHVFGLLTAIPSVCGCSYS